MLTVFPSTGNKNCVEDATQIVNKQILIIKQSLIHCLLPNVNCATLDPFENV